MAEPLREWADKSSLLEADPQSRCLRCGEVPARHTSHVGASAFLCPVGSVPGADGRMLALEARMTALELELSRLGCRR